MNLWFRLVLQSVVGMLACVGVTDLLWRVLPTMPEPFKTVIWAIALSLTVKATYTLSANPFDGSDIKPPPVGKQYAAVTPRHNVTYHRTLQQAKDILRPKRTRRWAQRIWPEGSVYEWRSGGWMLIYTANDSFTKRSV